VVAHHPQGHPHHGSSWHGEDTPARSVVFVSVPALPTNECTEQLRRQRANVEPDSRHPPQADSGIVLLQRVSAFLAWYNAFVRLERTGPDRCDPVQL
jgi:hypothetical protein